VTGQGSYMILPYNTTESYRKFYFFFLGTSHVLFTTRGQRHFRSSASHQSASVLHPSLALLQGRRTCV
jgi:hypothetical protein